MERKVVVICDDLFGLEVYTILNEINSYVKKNNIEYDTYQIKYFLSDTNNPFYSLDIPIPVICGYEKIAIEEETYFIMGIKCPEKKQKTAEYLKKKGAKFLSVLTPWTIVPDNKKIGEGCVISNFSFKEGDIFEDFVTMINVLSSNAHVGRYSTIDTLSNITNAEIEECVYIGAHSFLMSNIKIGRNSIIFPGSTVFGDVKESSMIAGIPANKVKYKKITENSIQSKFYPQIN